MDALSDILERVSVRGSVFCTGTVRAPWCMSGGATGVSLFHVVLEGAATAQHEDEVVELQAGDVLLLPRGERHVFGSAVDIAARPLRDSVVRAGPYARLVSDGDGEPCRLICGTFRVDELDRHPLLSHLPDLVLVHGARAAWLGDTLAGLESHIESDAPGSRVVVNKLLEILFIQAIASWLHGDDLPDDVCRAFADPNIGRALSAIHNRPGEHWTVNSLAREAAMSRTSFHRRFTELLYDPPATYLKRWRMTLAARWLESGELSVGEIGLDLGYSATPAFSRAFKEHFGVPPSQWGS